MNYSPLVLGFRKMGLSQDSVVVWGIVLTLLYGLTLFLLCGPCTIRQAFLWALLICSPASVLVIERGNLDIIIFALLVAALLLRNYPIPESCVILGASLIKFFPIVSLLSLWRERRKSSRITVIVMLVIFASFLILIRSRLLAIENSLGAQYQTAFGYDLFGNLMGHYGIINGSHVLILNVFFRIVAVTGLLFGFAVGWFFRKHTGDPPVSERSLHAFFLSAPLMLTLFIQGPQMDYKWIFFLLMVPALFELTHSRYCMEALLAKVWLCMMAAYSYWTFFSDEGSIRNALLKQLLMWGVIFITATLSARLWSRRIHS